LLGSLGATLVGSSLKFLANSVRIFRFRRDRVLQGAFGFSFDSG